MAENSESDGERSVLSAGLGPSLEEVQAVVSYLGLELGQYLAHLKLLSPSEARSEVDRVLHPSAPAAPGQTVIYGFLYGHLIFALESEALVMADVVDGWWNCNTWGEFRRRVMQAGRTELLKVVDEDGSRADDSPITDTEREHYTCDCDWPSGGALGDLGGWMPEEVTDLGEFGESMVTGPGLWFDEDEDLKVRAVAALERYGFKCRQDEDLLEAYSYYGVRGRSHFERTLTRLELEQLRKEASQYSTYELAREAGVCAQTVRRFSGGQGSPRPETGDRLRWGLTRLRPKGPTQG